MSRRVSNKNASLLVCLLSNGNKCQVFLQVPNNTNQFRSQIENQQRLVVVLEPPDPFRGMRARKTLRTTKSRLSLWSGAEIKD